MHSSDSAVCLTVLHVDLLEEESKIYIQFLCIRSTGLQPNLFLDSSQ